MAFLEASSQRKSKNFSPSRLYGREAVYHVLQALLAQPKGGLYETPWIGFDRHDLLHYNMLGSEFEAIKDELRNMVKDMLGTQDDVTINIENNENGNGINFNLTITDPFGDKTTYGTTIEFGEYGDRYRNIVVR